MQTPDYQKKDELFLAGVDEGRKLAAKLMKDELHRIDPPLVQWPASLDVISMPPESRSAYYYGLAMAIEAEAPREWRDLLQDLEYAEFDHHTDPSLTPAERNRYLLIRIKEMRERRVGRQIGEL